MNLEHSTKDGAILKRPLLAIRAVDSAVLLHISLPSCSVGVSRCFLFPPPLTVAISPGPVHTLCCDSFKNLFWITPTHPDAASRGGRLFLLHCHVSHLMPNGQFHHIVKQQQPILQHRLCASPTLTPETTPRSRRRASCPSKAFSIGHLMSIK